MKTTVGLYHELKRKMPWLVCWWGDPDPDTGRQRKYSKSFRYKSEARAFQASKQKELDEGGPRDRLDDVMLGQLLDEFREARLVSLSYSSRTCYDRTMDQLREHFGNNRKICQIEQRHAETFMATRKRRDSRSGELSSWTRFQHLKHCKAIFGAALDWGYIDRNPFKASRSSGSSALRIKARSRPWHHITPAEFALFIAAVPDARRKAMYWLMYACGLRPGEVYNLTIDNVNLERRRIHIVNREATDEIPPFTVKAEGQSTDSKERSISIPVAAIPDITEAMKQALKAGRFIALTPERFERVLEGWRLCQQGKPWGENKRHRPWQNRDMVNNVLKQTKGYFRKAGVELAAPLTLTTFRKSFGQNHADAGTPPRTLAKLMGHANVTTTMGFYNRVTDANEQAAAATLDRLFAGSGSGQKAEGA